MKYPYQFTTNFKAPNCLCFLVWMMLLITSSVYAAKKAPLNDTPNKVGLDSKTFFELNNWANEYAKANPQAPLKDLQNLLTNGLDAKDALAVFNKSAIAGNEPILALLAMTNVDKIPTPQSEIPVLHFLAMYNFANALQFVLDHKPDQFNINDQDTSLGWAPLHYAAHYSNTEAFTVLVEQGALLNVVAKKTLFTPVHLAIIFGQPSMVSFLMDKVSVSDLKQQDYANQIPLHLAVLRGGAVYDLIKKKSVKADYKLPDINGWTPDNQFAMKKMGWKEKFTNNLKKGKSTFWSFFRSNDDDEITEEELQPDAAVVFEAHLDEEAEPQLNSAQPVEL